MDALERILMEDAERVLADTPLDALDGKRVLVTGASGLVGLHLVGAIALARSRGIKVRLNAVVRRPPPAGLQRLFGSGFTTLQGDLQDPVFRASLPEVDCVIHGATSAQPTVFMQDPAGTLALSTIVTWDLLCRTAQGGSFLFISSAEVYSGLPAHPFKETEIGTTTPYHPRGCYIEGKRCGEAMCAAYRAKGLNAQSARLGHTYGAGVRGDDQRVVASFIRGALAEGAIRMRDSGAVQRTWCYVSDAVDAFFRIMLCGREAVYNVGGTSTLTIAELAHLLGTNLGVPVRAPEIERGIAGAPPHAELDLERTRTELGKTQYVTLEEGIARTIRWQRALA